LCLAGHVLMENRDGMVVDVEVPRATGSAVKKLRTGHERARYQGEGATCQDGDRASRPPLFLLPWHSSARQWELRAVLGDFRTAPGRLAGRWGSSPRCPYGRRVPCQG